MYPHPQLNSYLHGFNAHVPKKVLNRVIDKAMCKNASDDRIKSSFTRLETNQPQCYAPDVDVTRSKCAFGPYILPKLRRELHDKDQLIVRQAVTTLGDLLVNPEKLMEAVKLNITDRLADLIKSDDPYLRERVAIIYTTIANQAAGREAILKNLTALVNLLEGLDDELAAVRLKIAQALEILARDYHAAGQLCCCGFVESITAKLCCEKKTILIVYLETLKLLLHQNVKAKAIRGGTFDKLTMLLDRNDERVLCGALSCLGILCEDIMGKEKAIEVDLLSVLKRFLRSDKESVSVEAGRVASFITITTPGKLRVLELKMTSLLLGLASEKNCCNFELLLVVMKTLTNVAEAPEGRRILLDKIAFIEDINVNGNEVLMRHKLTLLDVIRWRP